MSLLLIQFTHCSSYWRDLARSLVLDKTLGGKWHRFLQAGCFFYVIQAILPNGKRNWNHGIPTSGMASSFFIHRQTSEENSIMLDIPCHFFSA